MIFGGFEAVEPRTSEFFKLKKIRTQKLQYEVFLNVNCFYTTIFSLFFQ